MIVLITWFILRFIWKTIRGYFCRRLSAKVTLFHRHVSQRDPPVGSKPVPWMWSDMMFSNVAQWWSAHTTVTLCRYCVSTCVWKNMLNCFKLLYFNWPPPSHDSLTFVRIVPVLQSYMPDGSLSDILTNLSGILSGISAAFDLMCHSLTPTNALRRTKHNKPKFPSMMFNVMIFLSWYS